MNTPMYFVYRETSKVIQEFRLVIDIGHRDDSERIVGVRLDIRHEIERPETGGTRMKCIFCNPQSAGNSASVNSET